MKYLAACLILSSTTACASVQYEYVDPDLTIYTTQIALVTPFVARLEAASGVQVSIVEEDCESKAHPKEVCLKVVPAESLGNKLAGKYSASGTIYIEDRPEVIDLVVAHEVLHWLHVDHGGDGLMGTHTGRSRNCISEWDLEALCSHHTCTKFTFECEPIEGLVAQ